METRNAYRISVGKLKVKRPLGRPGWEHSIKMDLRQDGGIDWVDVA
jgi:hypothetical protein